MDINCLIAKKKKKSTFRYELDDHTGTQKLFPKRSYGIYYTAAESLTEEREQNEQEREREKNEQGHFKCVIMNCEEDVCISQIKSFHEMGNEYVLEVIHIDNTESSNVKVIYPHFENTLSEWLKNLASDKSDILKKTDKYDQWMQYEVFPKIRKLWQILLKMKNNERNINKPYCLPLIDGMPKLLYIPEENDEKNKRDTSDDRSRLSNQGQRERESQHNPIEVFNKVLRLLQSSGVSYELPLYIEEAKEFWDRQRNDEVSLFNIHPVLYNSHEKSKFLQLFYDVTLECELDGWLDGEMFWQTFQDRIKDAKKEKVYEKTLLHKSQKRQSPAHNHPRSDQETPSSSHGFVYGTRGRGRNFFQGRQNTKIVKVQRRLNNFSYANLQDFQISGAASAPPGTPLAPPLYGTKEPKRRPVSDDPSSSYAPDQEQSDQESLSSSRGQSNQKTPNISPGGSYIVRFTRNVLAHFNDNDENPQGGRLAGDEIVEIVDRDLAVCSLYHTYAGKIIADPAGVKNGEKAKKKLAEFLESLK